MKNTIFIIMLSLLSFASVTQAISQEYIDQELRTVNDNTKTLEANDALSIQNIIKEYIDQELKLLTDKIENLETSVASVSAKIDSLHTQMLLNSNAFSQTFQELDLRIDETIKNANQRILNLGNLLSKTAQGLDSRIDETIKNSDQKILNLDNLLSKTAQGLDSRIDETIKKSDQKILDLDNLLSKTAQGLDSRIDETIKNADQKILNLDTLLSKTTLWMIIGILAAIVVSGVVYWLLRKKQQTDKTDLIEQLSKTKTSLEESLVKEFGKQTELMDAQLDVMKQPKPPVNPEPDHSLALKVADEITLIERNISHMNQETKGLKPLIRAIERLKDNLLSKGYELPELLGKPYVEGMRITIITSISDETSEKGKDVITKIIKPQVNYEGKLIQTAQVEILVGVK